MATERQYAVEGIEIDERTAATEFAAEGVQFNESVAGATATVTGTIVASQADEGDIVAGGLTITAKLTGATFKAAGTGIVGTIANTDALIAGLVALASPTNGWNDAVLAELDGASDLTRDGDDQVTLVLPNVDLYDISATETVKWTIPDEALATGSGPIEASPTFTIVPVAVDTYTDHLLMAF